MIVFNMKIRSWNAYNATHARQFATATCFLFVSRVKIVLDPFGAAAIHDFRLETGKQETGKH